jgi:hypothetical protein
MTPKEKARELTQNIKFVLYNDLPNLQSEMFNKAMIKTAKQCALISVNQLINIFPSVYLTYDNEVHSGHSQYWQQVKAEIEKL